MSAFSFKSSVIFISVTILMTGLFSVSVTDKLLNLHVADTWFQFSLKAWVNCFWTYCSDFRINSKWLLAIGITRYRYTIQVFRVWGACVCKCKCVWGGVGCSHLSSPFKGQCDIFAPKVSLHSSMWTLAANLKSKVMTLAACRCGQYKAHLVWCWVLIYGFFQSYKNVSVGRQYVVCF